MDAVFHLIGKTVSRVGSIRLKQSVEAAAGDILLLEPQAAQVAVEEASLTKLAVLGSNQIIQEILGGLVTDSQAVKAAPLATFMVEEVVVQELPAQEFL
jgi:hypothetical protein